MNIKKFKTTFITYLQQYLQNCVMQTNKYIFAKTNEPHFFLFQSNFVGFQLQFECKCLEPQLKLHINSFAD